MFKNVATSVLLFAYQRNTGAPKAGDGANITAYVQKDFGALSALAASAIEVASALSAADGWYKVALTSANTNADHLFFTGKSTTASVQIVGRSIYTTPNRFTTLSITASGKAAASVGTVTASVPNAKLGIIAEGTAQSASTAAITLASGTTFLTNQINDATILIATASAGAGQSRIIRSYTASTKRAVVNAWITVPTGTITYKVFATPGLDTSTASALAADVTSSILASQLQSNIASAVGSAISTATIVNAVTSAIGAESPNIASAVASALNVPTTAQIASAVGVTTGTKAQIASAVNATVVTTTPSAAKIAAIASAVGVTTGTKAQIASAVASATPKASKIVQIASAVASAVGSVSGYTPAQIAVAVLSAAGSTPIFADVRKINNAVLSGVGTVAQPWGPA